MNVTTAPSAFAPDLRADFPGLVTGEGASWHYLDTAATAQKPRAVIDAMARAMGEDYATVHRGVYARSAEMTLAYEAARRRIAAFIGGQEEELVFTRGATEAINLVANPWGRANLKPGDRILLSQIEHHSNIVPWQMLAEATGAEIDVCPLTEEHQIDLEEAERILTPAHKLVSFVHVSNVTGGVLDARRAADLAHSFGAKLLLDGCQAAPRTPVDVKALDCDFYVFSAHKLYGPTGIGALWARSEILDVMPPWEGGGAMIDRVSFEKTTYKEPPFRFEAGTPPIAQVIGLAAAIDYVQGIGMDAIAAYEQDLLQYGQTLLADISGITYYGNVPDKAGILSFNLDGAHASEVGMILDQCGVAVRTGHHCCMPLMQRYGVDATIRASLGLYSNEEDLDQFAEGLRKAKDMLL